MPLHDFIVQQRARPRSSSSSAPSGSCCSSPGVNVVNLLLARAADRQREMAIRASLGAGRGRLLRQLLVESVLLAAMGGLAGLLVGCWALGLDRARSGRTRSPPSSPCVSIRAVLAFTAGVSVLTGLLFGLAPGLRAAGRSVAPELKDGARAIGAPGREPLRRVLVASEIALSVVLLAGAGLLLRSLHRLQSVDPGFQPEQVADLQPHAAHEPLPRHPAPHGLLRVRARPRARAAGRDLGGGHQRAAVRPRARCRRTSSSKASPPVEPGREPDVHEPRREPRPTSARSASRCGAAATWSRPTSPPREPVGHRERGGGARRCSAAAIPIGRRVAWARAEPRVWIRVVGVAGDVRGDGLDAGDTPALYTPDGPGAAAVADVDERRRALVACPPAALAELGQARGRPRGQGRARHARAGHERAAGGLASPDRQFTLALLGAFAVVAVVLAGVGIYGVMAYAVSRRTREIGLRMALGARAQDVVRLVLGQAMAVTLLGVAAGPRRRPRLAARSSRACCSAWAPATRPRCCAVAGAAGPGGPGRRLRARAARRPRRSPCLRAE